VKHLRTCSALLAALLGGLLVLPLAAAALLLAGMARLTAWIAARLEPPHLAWNELIEFDPELGWKPKPMLDVHYLADRDPEVFHVVTDADGWPGRHGIEESEIVVFGDSFAFGFGVDAEKSFAAEGPGPRVKAIGAPGYNGVQELMLMQQLAPSLAGKLVVWLLYYGNDLYDNLSPEMSGYRTPFLARSGNREAEWEIVNHHVTDEPWTSSGRRETARQLADLHSDTELARRAFSACAHLVEQAREACKHAGASLVVVGLPTPRVLSPRWLERIAAHASGERSLDPSLPDRELARICQQADVPFVAGRDHFTVGHYRPVDDHWNERGHRVMRELLSGLLRRYAGSETAPTSVQRERPEVSS
jgi:hypothetical protein